MAACLSACVGIAATGLASLGLGLSTNELPLLVAPMGASAVLLFAVPSSPLAQPWSIMGGNVISAIVGVAVTRLVPDMMLAAGLAVGLAMVAMSLCRCLHPPGGAVALTAVVGGPAVAAAGYGFAFVPVGLNSALLLGTALIFHRFSGHSYPHRPGPITPGVLHRDDIDRALGEVGETFDITPEDLQILFQRAQSHAAERTQPRRRKGRSTGSAA